MIKTSKWFSQYGRWDLRIGCPKCGKKEAFFCSLKDVNEDNIIDGLRCRTCGWKGDIKFLGDVDTAVVNVDRREKTMSKFSEYEDEDSYNKIEIHQKKSRVSK